jgi:hypothetical protein
MKVTLRTKDVTPPRSAKLFRDFLIRENVHWEGGGSKLFKEALLQKGSHRTGFRSRKYLKKCWVFQRIYDTNWNGMGAPKKGDVHMGIIIPTRGEEYFTQFRYRVKLVLGPEVCHELGFSVFWGHNPPPPKTYYSKCFRRFLINTGYNLRLITFLRLRILWTFSLGP